MKRSTETQRKYVKEQMEIREYQAFMDKRRQIEKEMFEKYEALESTQIFKTANNLIQKATQREMALNQQYQQLASEVGLEAFETIESLFDGKGDVSDEHFEMIYSSIRFLLRKVQKMSDDARAFNTQQYNQLPVYDELFTKLIRDVDCRFIVYAPVRVLSSKSRVVGFKKISGPMAIKLYARIKDMGLLQDEKLATAYATYLSKCVETEKQEVKSVNIEK